ncbi:hypothetical protein HKCCE2091_08290, partial [Rhodobacterales bacterium HKCCE2091]|nr:hypothetical protein [Rhodobacterales bacterium HKCCE2091]
MSMTRGLSLLIPAFLALAACDRPVPDDTMQGVGFNDYVQYGQGRAAAQAQLAGQPAGQIARPVANVAPPAASGGDPVA